MIAVICLALHFSVTGCRKTEMGDAVLSAKSKEQIK